MTKVLLRQKPSRLCYRAVEFRAADTAVTDGHTLEGYAAVFNEPTVIDSFFGSFSEQIARGAFKKTLSERTPVLQFDHGRDARTGSVPIGAVQDIHEDSKGLFVQARLFDNPVVEPIRQAISGGAIDGMSFRFRVLQEQWRDAEGNLINDDELFDLLAADNADEMPVRTIKEVELFEAGPVVFPAYDATSVGVRSMLAALNEPERFALISELREEVLADEEHPGDEDDPAEDETNEEDDPADGGEQDVEPAVSHSASTEPARSHSVYLGEAASWYLATPDTGSY